MRGFYAKYSSWLAAACLSFSAFVFNTTEFAPIGLLNAISASFDMNPAHTGYMVTIYAAAVAILSLPLTILTAKIDRKKLLIVLFAIFIISHIVIGASRSFAVLMIGRIGVACAHAVFWAIAVPLAVRLAPSGGKSKALGAVVAGSSLAAVMGVPIGTLIGQNFGWRVTFLIIACAAALVLVLLIKILPSLPSKNAGSFKSLPFLFGRAKVVWIYILTAVIVTGDFAVYTYIDPFLSDKGYERSFTALPLLVMGGAGLIGSYIFGLWGDKRPIATLIIPLGILFALFALFELSASSFYFFIALCLVWGTIGVMIFMSLQSRLLDAARDAADVANSIYSAIFNVGIGGGALVGSVVSLAAGVNFIGYAGAGAIFVSFVLCLAFLIHTNELRLKRNRH